MTDRPCRFSILRAAACGVAFAALAACATERGAPDPSTETEERRPVLLTTADGLVIEDVRVGEGDPCPPGATVVVRYTGTLPDGTVFDSTDSRGRAMTFELPRLIRGWQQGVPGMRPGGVRKLTIPYALAYGEQGRPPRIPPRADLMFEIELISFEPAR